MTNCVICRPHPPKTKAECLCFKTDKYIFFKFILSCFHAEQIDAEEIEKRGDYAFSLSRVKRKRMTNSMNKFISHTERQ